MSSTPIDSPDEAATLPVPAPTSPPRSPKRSPTSSPHRSPRRDDKKSPTSSPHRHRGRSRDETQHRSRSHDSTDVDGDGKRRGRSHDSHYADGKKKHHHKNESGEKKKDHHHHHRSRSHDNKDLEDGEKKRDHHHHHHHHSKDDHHHHHHTKDGHHDHASKKKKDAEAIKKLCEEMERHQKEMEESNKKMRNQMNDQRIMSRLVWLCGCFFVIGAIAAVVVVLVLRESNDDAPVETNSPTVPIPPSSSPTEIRSSPPSGSPTIDILFDPPSREDCLAIQNGDSVTDQENMIVKDFQLDVDVTVNSPDYDITTLLPQFQTSIDTILIPELVGCFDVQERDLKQTSLRGQSRNLQSTDAIRYIFGNAISQVEVTEQECLEVAVPGNPCYRIATYLESYLKEDEFIFRIISLIADILIEAEDDPIISRFGLPSEVLNAEVIGVISLTPTMSPSSLPSSFPSSFPSSEPTNIASADPTVSPSETPSVAPTKVPSRQPSAMPSSSPTIADLSSFFSEVIEADPLEGDDEVEYTVNCDGDNGDIVVLARGASRDSVTCLGHLQHDDYLNICDDGADRFSVTLEIDLCDYEAYEEVLIGYSGPSGVQAFDCDLRSMSLGTLAPSFSPSVSSAPSSAPTNSRVPSQVPSDSPSKSPSRAPSLVPSDLPSTTPSIVPSRDPTPA